MDDKKGNIILGIILAILMIIAIAIVIINPNKVETVNYAKEQGNINSEEVTANTNKTNNEELEKEEKQKSMEDGTTKKLAQLPNGASKIYFDGENIFAIPDYYSGKGIYKIDLEGNVTKIYDGSSLQLWITDEKVYFVNQIGYDTINQNPQGTLCSMDKDGKNVKNIAEKIKNYFAIHNDKIYYTAQNRKMHEINIDGSNDTEIAQGRKFVITLNDKYLTYVDYAEQEAIHILNLETKDDVLVGYFGMVREYAGNTYINIRKRLDDGSLDEKYTLFNVKEDGTATEIGQFADFGTNLNYIINDKIYVGNSRDGVSIVNLKNGEKQTAEDYNNCRYYLGGYGYKVDDSNLDDIKVEKIEL